MYDSFGFSTNIFNIKPLYPCKRDLNKFIGRVKDIKDFLVDISSEDGVTVLVTGHRGVGKTSFVNIIEYAIAFDKPFLQKYLKINTPNIIPCYHKIQLEPNEKVKDILSKSLSSLLFSIQQFGKDKNFFCLYCSTS